MVPTLDEMLAEAKSGNPHALGAAVSPIDDRDYVAYPPAPGVENLDYVGVTGLGQCPIYSQQGGTCTGYSIAAILSYLEYRETGARRTFDGSELHHRLVPSYTNGVWPRDVLEDVRLRGAEAQAGAGYSALYRISGYAGVPLDVDSILTALKNFGPLQIVTWLGKDFQDQWYQRRDYFVPAPAARQEDVLHSMLIVAGERSQGAVIQNNWGIQGGVPFAGAPGGFHKVTWDWIKMQACEAWSLADMSNTTQEGWIKNHEETATADGFTLVRRPDRPAVYAVLGETRDWISNQQELFARGFGGALRAAEARYGPSVGVSCGRCGRAREPSGVV